MIRRATLVAGRELAENVRTRGFWFSLLVLPLAITIGLAIPLVAELAEPVRHYAVVDRSGWVLEAVARNERERSLRHLLQRWLERSQRDPGAMARLDGAEPLTRVLAALGGDTADSPRVEAVARWLAGDGGSPPHDALEAELHEAFRSWWAELPPGRIRELAPDASRARFERVHPAAAYVSEATATAWLARERIFAYAVIPEDPVGGTPGDYVARNLTSVELRRWLAERVTEVVRAQRLAEAGIDPATFDAIEARWRLETRRASAGATRRADVGDALEQWGPVAFVYILWMSIFTVTQMLLTNTVEEKSNKLVEVLLASISPLELMAGKILGIAATGLTIVATWIASFVAAAVLLPAALGAPAALDVSGLAANPVYLGSFLLYFVLGYFFYAALLCGVGSVCNTIKEAQNLLVPVQVLLAVPLILMVPIARDPSGALAQALAWVPPLTPFVMMNRAAQPPEAWIYVGTGALMLLATAAALWAAAKIFRIGILMTGTPPGLREILRWIAAPVGPPGLSRRRDGAAAG